MVQDLKNAAPGQDPPDVCTFANRRHVALRATLSGVAHDAINPLSLINTGLYLLQRDASGAVDRSADPFKERITHLGAMAKRAIDEVRVLQAVTGRTTHAIPPRFAAVASVVAAVVRSADITGSRMQVQGETRGSVLASVGDFELAIASMLLHVYEEANRSQRQPIAIALGHNAEGGATIAIAPGTPAQTPPSQSSVTATDMPQERLAEAIGIIAACGGTVDISSHRGAHIAISLPHVTKPVPANQG